MNIYPQSWEALDIAWRDGTHIATLPRGGILDAMHPEAEAERLAQEAEQARREELRAENVIVLNDHRWRKRDEHRETL